MNVHHLEEGGEHQPENLITTCVACHAILHLGRNLAMAKLQVWKSETPQVEIVRVSREEIGKGKGLEEINAGFGLELGPYPPDSVEYANKLIENMGSKPRASLEKPLCAVFVDFSRWQLS